MGLRKLSFCLILALLREQDFLYMPVNKEDSKRYLTASQIFNYSQLPECRLMDLDKEITSVLCCSPLLCPILLYSVTITLTSECLY